MVDFEVLDSFGAANPPATNAEMFRQIAARNPEFRLRVLTADATLSQDGREADRYITTEVTGQPVGVTMRSIVRQLWKQCDREWFMTSNAAMRFPTADWL